jgi:hypothetical protein
MKIRQKMQVKWVSILLCMLALTLFLGACSNGQGTTGNAASAPTPTPTPTPTPIPTPTGTAYSGTGFTLTYPKGWKEVNQSAATGETYEFGASGASSNTGLTVTVSAPVQTVDIDAALAAGITELKGIFTNFQQDNSIASTTTIAGDSWKQEGGTGDSQGQHLKAVVLVDHHAANNRLYVIVIIDNASTFDQDQTTIFQPILQSFKFV